MRLRTHLGAGWLLRPARALRQRSPATTVASDNDRQRVNGEVGPSSGQANKNIFFGLLFYKATAAL